MKEEQVNIYRRNIEEAPLHQFLGIKIKSLGEYEATVTIPVNSHTINSAGNLHGGVMYLVSDVTSFAALGPSLEENEFPVTIDYHCSIYRGTRLGPITIQSKVADRTRKLAFISAKLHDGEGRLLAEARVTKAIVHTVPEVFKA